MNSLIIKHGKKIDLSRADYQIAKRMAQDGYSAEIIKKTILEGSPELSNRKNGHVEDYLDRTISSVFSGLDSDELKPEKAEIIGARPTG